MRELLSYWGIVCLLGAFGACSSSSTTECGGVICPTSKVCHLPLELCLVPEQLTTCVSLDDGDSCSFPGAVNGKCKTEICHSTVCGNSTIDFAEVCDDGNTESGDGCSADCRSDESCGNGILDAPREQCDDGNGEDGDGCQASCLLARCGDEIVDETEACDDGNLDSDDGCNQICSSDETCGNGFPDFEQGEQCDDGGFRSQDGCTSQCTAELPLWIESDLEGRFSRNRPRLVFHAARGQLVLYGGTGPIGESVLGTHELLSGQWSRVVGGIQPPSTKEQVFVYDASRRVALSFGGVLPVARPPGAPLPPAQSPYGDTWEFGIAGWQMTSPAIAPVARSRAAGAYDAVRMNVVMFGGHDGSLSLNDTWLYDGSWTQIVTNGPSARSGHVMAYDYDRDRLVLFGGLDSLGDELRDTWEWDGASWTEITGATTVPSARGSMAYLPGVGVVSFGGSDSANNSTWIFDGSDWSEFAGAAPPARFGAAMKYDPSRAALVMFGGGPGNSLRDMWTFDGNVWSELTQTFSLGARQAALLAHDTLRRRTYFYGGRVGSEILGDLWEWNGVQFLEVDDISEPTPTALASAFLFDKGRGCYLMTRPGPEQMELFELCGRVWTKVETINSPPSRGQSSLSFDSVRSRLVLFGGNMNGSQMNDTWEFDGQDWTQVLVNLAPSPRSYAMMGFDAARSRIILFGGNSDMGLRNDTWAYDQNGWMEIVSSNRPGPRFGAGMVYNTPRERIMIHGGEPGPIGDSWELGNTGWDMVTEPQRPRPSPFPAIGFDETRKRVVLVGGTQLDVWEFSYASTTATEICSGNQDEDRDGLVDCEDPDCEDARCGPGAMRCSLGSCTCAQSVESLCGDEFDGDCDGLVDCADPDCASSADCTTEVSCADGLDDDGDGRVDCADFGCRGLGFCEEFETRCDDGLDNDGDGRTDCSDLDCFLVPCAEQMQ